MAINLFCLSLGKGTERFVERTEAIESIKEVLYSDSPSSNFFEN